ncbi:MAG: hypothetical protein AVDCRST_MAG95-1629, partial [uncultured Adhaeribacter sp.]
MQEYPHGKSDKVYLRGYEDLYSF